MSLRKNLILVSALSVVSLSLFAAAPPPPAGSDAVVARLYKDFAWEVAPDHPEQDGLIDQKREVLSRYFDETLTKLILDDRACAAKEQGVCHLDFSPIWDSNDPGAKNVKVLKTNDPALVKVTFIYPGNGEVISLTYHMVQTKAGWRIHDIGYKGHESLLTLLRMKI